MNFTNLVINVLNETSIAGGAGSVFGSSVTKTSTVNSGDNYAKENGSIVPHLLGGRKAKMITRFGNYKKTKKRKK